MMEEIIDSPERERSGPGQLSYSTGKDALSCEYRFYLERAARVPYDKDLPVDTYAFRFGTAVHAVMERTLYDYRAHQKQFITDAVLAEGLEEDDFYKVFACCQSLYREHSASGLKILKCETKISGATTFGYIDAVGVDRAGRWWIMDLKTTSWFQALTPLRLRRDPQLCIYAAHAADVAAELELDVEDFAGVAYRVVTKPKAQPKPLERLSEYAARTKVQTRTVYIHRAYLDVSQVLREHNKNRDRCEAILSGEIPESQIRRNLNACVDYNKPCKFWSKCYGASYTDCLAQIVISEPDNLIDASTVFPVIKEPEMLNIKCLGTQVFNNTRVRVDMSVVMGAHEFARPYYFDAENDADAEAVNDFITEAKKQVRLEFFVHLAACADDAMYQNWAKKLGVAAIPASEKGAKSEAAPTPVAEAAPAAKPTTKAAAVKEEEAAPAKEEKPAAKSPAASKKQAKKDDVTIYAKGVPENGNALKAEVSKHWGEGWAKDAAKKAQLGEIANALVENEVPVFRNGEVAEEFVAFVAEQCGEESDI